MDLNRSIDIYCERLGPEFWAEPVNAITNGAFFVAALLAWRYAQQHEQPPRRATQILIILIALIGLGSTLFHTFGTMWAAIADVTPIYIFTVLYAFISIHRTLDIPHLHIAAGLGVIGGVVYAAINLWPFEPIVWPPAVRGSLSYAPALVAMYGFATALYLRRLDVWQHIAVAGAVFTLSLTFRSIDPHICTSFPLGTHFMWHILNGVVLYTLMHGLIRFSATSSTGRP